MIRHIITPDLCAPYDADRDDLIILPLASPDQDPAVAYDAPTHALELVRGGTRYAVTLWTGDAGACRDALAQILAQTHSATIHLP